MTPPRSHPGTSEATMTAYQKLLLEAIAMRTPAEIAQWKRKLRLMKENANAR